MVFDQGIPAAQYLRMSTEHQRYSMENQSSAIQRYAESRGFAVVRTYCDVARSGISLKRRAGLKQLLEDVMSGGSCYKVILVYDVSRWGRFQDIDESGHYEFLCKSAGVPVHYCAESFANDGAFPNLVMKVLKRTMAAEYSRELGAKVLAGQKRLARLGFKQGGVAGYGLRRMLVSHDRQPKQQLTGGERKSIATDRVILVPGPSHEVNVVREVYQMLIEEKLSVYAIARQLNRRGIQYQGNSNWNYGAVYSVLTHPKYAGVHVFGRTSSRLSSACVRSPQSEWIIYPDAFAPVIDRQTFAKAQKILVNRTVNKSNDEILKSLKELVAREGRLSFALIKESGAVPSPSAFRTRFGGLRRAYELIGYGQSRQFDFIDQRHRTQALREELITTIAEMFASDVSIVRRGGRWRTKLLLQGTLTVSVLVSRSVRVSKGSVRWLIDPAQDECRHVTLLAKMDETNGFLKAFHLLPNINRATRFRIEENDSWLNRGVRLNDLSQFCVAALAIASRH